MTGFIIFLLMIMQGQATQEYTVKRGDEITVTVWEKESLSGTAIVDSNGSITLPMPIGSVPVVGKNATQITQILTERLKEYLVSPTVFVSISPAEGFNVHILGEVNSPNFVRVPEGTTVQEAITRVGGFTTTADKSHLRLIRTDEDLVTGSKKTTEMTIDFNRFIEETDLSANPALKANDVLIVPKEKIVKEEEKYKYIAFFGAVNNPGIIEQKEPLSLIRAIALAKGLSDSALVKEISILTVTDKGISRKNVDFDKFLKDGDLSANPIINLGDMIFVPTKPEEEPPITVNIMGQVSKPGKYPMVKGSRVLDVIYEAGGFIDDAVLDNISIIRANSESAKTEIANIKEYLISKDINLNPIILDKDTIIVPISKDASVIPSSLQAFVPTIRINVIGEVSKPGTYQVSESSNLWDVLKIAGGYSDYAKLDKVIIIRKNTETGEKKVLKEFNLQKVLETGDFDSLPNLVMDDTIYIQKKSSETVWRTIVRTASEISTIITTFYLITGRAWR